MSERILLINRLKDQYATLRAKVLSGKGSAEEEAEWGLEMARIRQQRAELEPRRPVGRPRKYAVGTRKSRAMGTAGQQAEARSLRVKIKACQEELAKLKARFAYLAQRGGPSH